MPSLDIPAPMPGSILQVLVAPGDRVNRDQELFIIESMKMEIPLESPAAGTVRAVLVDSGQRIDEGQVLVRIETP